MIDGLPNEDEPDRFVEPDDVLPRKEFKPTVNRPLPTFQCTVIKADGERCKRQAEMGFTQENAKCPSHGGDHNMSREKNQSRIEAARIRLVDNVDLALDTIVSLTEEGTADGVRLKAATEILDRAGLRAGFELDVKEELKITTSDDIKKKLEALFRGEENLQSDDEIVDAEVVEVKEIEE